MEHTIAVLKAISQETRLRILMLLAETELCSCQLGEVLGVSQPGISQHMSVLKHAGLVSERRSGTRVHYQLVRSRLVQVLHWLTAAIEAPRSIASQSVNWNKLDRLSADRQLLCEQSDSEMQGVDRQ
ncbi:MAG: ArsR/SmtB family transcription factor [Bacillota bacterium]|jgi:ArsR family transcriptional regulator